MKLKSLLLASLLMGTASAFAIWEKPVPAFKPMVDDGVTVQYLYNVDAGGFFHGGNDWNTRASISYKAGAQVKMTQTDPGAAWAIVNNGKGTNNNNPDEFLKMFAENAQSIWVDNNNGANCDAWVIDSNGDGTYTISNPAAGDGLLGMCKVYNGAEGNTRLWLIGGDLVDGDGVEIPHSGDCTTWAFVSVDEYNAVIAKMQECEAAANLKVAIDAAHEKYASLDLSAQEAVYNNEESPVAQLNAAISAVEAAVKQADKEAAEASASVDDPKDMTSYIVNPNFDGIKFNGWSGTGWNADGTQDECAERYNMVFDTYQDICDLPQGVYKVLVNGFYRGPEERTPYLYGASTTDTLKVNIQNQSAGGSLEPVEDAQQQVTIDVDGVTYYVPNSMRDFVRYENAGFYNDMSICVPVNEDGKLRIGVKKETTGGTDWVIVDSFRLLYLGKAADAYQALMDAQITNMKDYTNAKATKSVKEAYLAVADAHKTATSMDEVRANVAAIEAAAKEIEENVKVWEKYAKVVADAKLIAEDEQWASVDGAAELAEYATVWYPYYIGELEGYEELGYTLTAEEVQAEIEKVEGMRKSVMSQMKPGTDVSNMLKNPDFSQGWTGWQHSGTGGNVAANSSAKCAEAWNSANFNIYQEIEDAPAGVYEISVQGFYRYKRGNDSWLAYFNEDGSRKDASLVESYITEAPAYVYLNDSKTPLLDVYGYQVPNGDLYTTTGDLAPYVDPNGEFWYPNDMSAAGQAFDQGAYKMSAFGLVAKEGDKLRIGVKGNSNQAGDSWAIFTRFKLTYQAFDASIIQPELQKAITALQEKMGNTMGADVKAEAEAAIAAGQKAIAGSNGKEMAAALGDIYTVTDKVAASAKIFADLEEKLQELDDKMNESEASDETQEEAGMLKDNITDEMTEYTNADAEKAIKDIDGMIAKLAIPAYEDASDDNPVDMTGVIKDADFPGVSASGSKYGAWDFTKNGGNGPSYSGGNAVEFWNGSASALTFTLTQVVEVLPAGTYELTVEANNSYNGQAPGETGGRACLFAQVGENENVPSVVVEPNEDPADSYKPYSVIFKIDEDNTPVTLGVKSVGTMDARWFSCDNFTLTYYGKDSAKEVSGDAIAATGVESAAAVQAAAPVAIFSVGGVQQSQLKKGAINIVRLANGKVVKIMVK